MSARPCVPGPGPGSLSGIFAWLPGWLPGAWVRSQVPRPAGRGSALTVIYWPGSSVNHFLGCPSLLLLLSLTVTTRPLPVDPIFEYFHKLDHKEPVPITYQAIHSSQSSPQLCAHRLRQDSAPSPPSHSIMAGGPGGNSRGRGGKFKKPTRGGTFPDGGPARPCPIMLFTITYTGP